MTARLERSIDEPIREGLSWDDKWKASDKGLILSWEMGRQMRLRHPELGARADKGELMPLSWKGGVEEKLEAETKPGTLHYLATWQGLRGEDLDIATDGEQVIVCSRTGQTVVFGS